MCNGLRWAPAVAAPGTHLRTHRWWKTREGVVRWRFPAISSDFGCLGAEMLIPSCSVDVSSVDVTIALHNYFVHVSSDDSTSAHRSQRRTGRTRIPFAPFVLYPRAIAILNFHSVITNKKIFCC